LNYGPTLFYGSEASGGLVPDGPNQFTAVDIISFPEEETVNSVEGHRYFHAYTTFYSIYECIPGLPD
jgi:hypothetical protein